jgi:hypothetical protein
MRFLLFHDSGGKGKIEEKAGRLAIPKLAETLRIGFPSDVLNGLLALNRDSAHQPRVKIVFPVLTCTIARGPSHTARAFAEDKHAVTSRRTCS